MSFSQEIKDFTGNFEKGWKLATPTYSEAMLREKHKDDEGLALAGDKEEGVARERRVSALPISGGSGRSLPTMAQGDNADTTGVLQRASSAISGIESGGRYDAVGPTHPRYGKALGKYQVMEANLPKWTEAYVGRRMNADEFLGSPEAQEKVFKGEFGRLVKQYGNVEDAASVWHSGSPLKKASARGARDSLGTSTVDYARRVGAQVGKRADAAIPLYDEDEQPTQFAASGGMIERAPPVRHWVDTLPPDEEVTARDQIDDVRGEIPGSRASAIPVAYSEEDVRRLEGSPQVPVAESEEDVRRLEGSRPVPVAMNEREVQRLEGSSTQPGKRAIPLPPRRPDGLVADNGKPLPGEGMTAESDEPYNPKALVHPAGIGDAIEAGLKEIGKFFGFGQDSAGIPQARQGREASVQRFARNEGAATPTEIASIDKTIDPRGELSDDEKSVARLYGGYKYFLNKGEPEKAAKYAKSILMYTRLHVQTAGALAQERLQAGDVPGAARIMSEASTIVPDGHKVDLKPNAEGGVDYAMYDEDGDLTERGKANVNQLMAKATGMRNGSEWLAQLDSAKAKGLTAAQKLKQKNMEKDQAADDAFQGGNDDSAFMSSMTPEQKQAYKSMSPSMRGRTFRRWKDEQAGKRQQDAADQRTTAADAKTKAAERKAQDEQEYAGHIDKIRDAQEALDAQLQDNPADDAKIKPLRDAVDSARRAASDWTAGDAGRGKYVPQLNRELRALTRGGRGAGSSATGSGASSSGSGGRGGSADERNALRLDQAYETARNQARAAGKENDPATIRSLGVLKSEIEFQKRDTGLDDKAHDKIDEVLPSALGVDDVTNADPGTVMDHRDAIGGIMRGGNNISAQQAASLARIAIKTGKIERLDDGRYKIGDRAVYLSPEGFNAIARIYQRENPRKETTTTVPNPMSNRTATADQKAQADETLAAQSGNELDRRRAYKNREMLRLQETLGVENTRGMTLSQMRRAATQKSRDRSIGGRE